MKKLSKSIQRVDWNVACFGLLKIQDRPLFPVSKELLLTVLHKFPPKKGLFSISYTSVPLKTRRQGTNPLIQDSKFSARRAYGKVTKSPSLKKTRITKTKAKESYPLSRLPENLLKDMMLPAEKVMVQFCYRGRRRKISWLCNNSQLPRKTSQEKAKGLKTDFLKKNPARPPRNE